MSIGLGITPVFSQMESQLVEAAETEGYGNADASIKLAFIGSNLLNHPQNDKLKVGGGYFAQLTSQQIPQNFKKQQVFYDNSTESYLLALREEIGANKTGESGLESPKLAIQNAKKILLPVEAAEDNDFSITYNIKDPYNMNTSDVVNKGAKVDSEDIRESDYAINNVLIFEMIDEDGTSNTYAVTGEINKTKDGEYKATFKLPSAGASYFILPSKVNPKAIINISPDSKDPAIQKIISAINQKDTINIYDETISLENKGEPVYSNIKLNNMTLFSTKKAFADKVNSEEHKKGSGDLLDYELNILGAKDVALQAVGADVQSGGIQFGINSDLSEGSLAVNDINFGNLKINDKINAVKSKNLITVKDWTGADGWRVTAKHKDVSRNNSLQLSVKLANKKAVDFTNTEAVIAHGQSLFVPQTFVGEYLAEWGGLLLK